MRLGARFACTTLAFTGLITFAACGSSGGGGDDDGADDDDDDTTTPDANTTLPPDADLTGFTELIGRDWEIPPGEHYRCVRIQVENDVLIHSFHAGAPLGTHHTVLTVSDSGPVGEYECNAGALDSEMLFASGVGTDNLAFPADVAIRVSAGRYLNLNLHLFNTTNSNLSGHSSIWVETVDSVDPAKEAEMVFAGTFIINVPGHETADATGGCTFDDPATLLAYWPHMHQIATHQKVTLRVGGEDLVLHDDPYSFAEQKNYPLDTPIEVAAGDSIEVVCSYDNPGANAVTFGESSTTEMCFTGLYRYPKQAESIFECSTPCSPTNTQLCNF